MSKPFPLSRKKRALDQSDSVATRPEGIFMPDKIFRRPAVQDITGLSRSTLYAMIAEGRFPAPVKLGTRAVGWRETDLTAWLASREAA